MTKESSRPLRVAEQIKRLLALLLRDEVRDPRVAMATVSDVEVSADLAHARVYVTVLGGGEAQGRAAVTALNHAAGFLRRALGRQLTLRSVPELRFFYDDLQERGNRIEALIEQARAQDLAVDRDSEGE